MMGTKMNVFLTVVYSSLVMNNCQDLTTGHDLFDQYSVIFPNGNRNAASHRWASYIIERGASLQDDTIQSLFSHFCPVSGSPIGALRDEGRRWEVTLPSVSGSGVSGVTYLCCSPCICDVQAWTFIDTKTISTASGERQYNFLVIGNPCVQPSAIPISAPDVNCDGEELLGATFSDGGYVIIGMLFDDDGYEGGNHADMAQDMCQERAEAGYNSGMGQIFIEVAGISPIVVGTQLSVGDPSAMTVLTQSSAAVADGGLDQRSDGIGEEPEDLSRASMLLAPLYFTAMTSLVLVLPW